MRYTDGRYIEDDELISIFPRRIEIGENYEIWQHPYIKNGVLESDIDIQLNCFSENRKVISYYLSETSDRLSDPNHLGRMQLTFHDISDDFEEHIIIVNNIFSDETDNLIKSILLEGGIKYE